MAEYINIQGTTGRTCECGCKTWKEHWEKYSGRRFGICAHGGCKNEATVGAHVQEKGGGNTTWYILPLCRTHNHCSVVDLDVDGRCLLVSVR